MTKKIPTSAFWAQQFLQGQSYAYRRGHYFEWNGRCYDKIPDMRMFRRISEFIQQVDAAYATGQMVKNVAETIAQMTALDDEPPEPLNLNGQLTKNIIPFANGFLSVDDYIEDKLNDDSLHPPF